MCCVDVLPCHIQQCGAGKGCDAGVSRLIVLGRESGGMFDWGVGTVTGLICPASIRSSSRACRDVDTVLSGLFHHLTIDIRLYQHLFPSFRPPRISDP